MESPVRKMQKRNDYNRHKLLRKIKRQRKARAEQEAHAAEKELKKRLKLKMPRYEDGKDDYYTAYVDDINQTRVNPETGGVQVLDQNGSPIINEGGYQLPELIIKPSAPQTPNQFQYEKWLLREAYRGGKNFSTQDRISYNNMMQRLANQNENQDVIGYDGTIYHHGSGALETVSPEFDLLPASSLVKGAFKYGISKLAARANKLHIGNYYLNPRYNGLSYIRQVGDDAVEDMLRTGQMRTSEAIFDEQYAKLVAEVGEEEAEKIAFPDVLDVNANTVYNGFDFGPKTFNRNMFYTGRPFYGPVRTNYIITKPHPVTKQKDLVKKGIEWIEDGHKGHTRAAKSEAIKQGLDPNTAAGRIVDPVYNGDMNIIPLSEFGAFDLYRPASAFGFKLPFYKRMRFNNSK